MSAKAEGLGITQNEMESLVRRILDGADLSKTTGKIVRERVIKEIGERAGPDMRALKHSIRDALKNVLNGHAQEISQPAQQPSPVSKPNSDKGIANGNQVKRDVGKHGTKTKSSAAAAGGHAALAGTAAQDSVDENEHPSVQMKKSEPTVPMQRKRRARTVVDEDEDDENIDETVHDDDEAFDNGVGGSKLDPKSEKAESRPRPAKTGSSVSHLNQSPSIQTIGANSRKVVAPTSTPRPAKRSRPNTSAERRLEKLRSICRQLGSMTPPARMRGKSVPDKCTAVLEYLRQKGIEDPDPTSLTRKEVAVHRARLEQEKELAGLDTRFVSSFFLHPL